LIIILCRLYVSSYIISKLFYYDWFFKSHGACVDDEATSILNIRRKKKPNLHCWSLQPQRINLRSILISETLETWSLHRGLSNVFCRLCVCFVSFHLKHIRLMFSCTKIMCLTSSILCMFNFRMLLLHRNYFGVTCFVWFPCIFHLVSSIHSLSS